MRIPESELIINSDGSAFHIHLRPEEIADNIILVGDPGRVAMVAKYLTDIEFEHNSREFVSTTGKYNGKRITVLSTGIGTDNCDIVMNELDALANIDFTTREVKPVHRCLNILRIGTSGAVQPDIPIGSFVFAKYSLGADGLINWYAGRNEVAIPEMTEALRKHMNWNENLLNPYFIAAGEEMVKRFEDCSIMGCTISAQGFYGPQGRVLRLPLAMPNMIADLESFRFGDIKVTNFEMESSAIAGIGRLLGHNCGTICCIIAQRQSHGANTDYKPKVEELVRLALEKLSA